MFGNEKGFDDQANEFLLEVKDLIDKVKKVDDEITEADPNEEEILAMLNIKNMEDLKKNYNRAKEIIKLAPPNSNSSNFDALNEFITLCEGIENHLQKDKKQSEISENAFKGEPNNFSMSAINLAFRIEDVSQDALIENISIYLKKKYEDDFEHYKETDINNIIKSIEKGFCQGLSALYCYKKMAGQLENFKEDIRAIAYWDGKDVGKIDALFTGLLNDVLWLQSQHMDLLKEPMSDFANAFRVLAHKTTEKDEMSRPETTPSIQEVFSFSYNFYKDELKEFFEKNIFIHEGDMILLGDPYHAISAMLMKTEKGIYTVFNPDDQKGEQEFVNLQDAINHINKSFRNFSEKEVLPLGIRIFRESRKLEQGEDSYPDPEELYRSFLAKDDLEQRKVDNVTILHTAAFDGQTDIFKEKNLDQYLNVQDIRGKTPLHMAYSHNQLEFFSELIDRGADPNIKDGNENTILYLSIRYGKREFVEKMLNKMQKPLAKNFFMERDKFGVSNLAYFVTNGMLDLIPMNIKDALDFKVDGDRTLLMDMLDNQVAPAYIRKIPFDNNVPFDIEKGLELDNFGTPVLAYYIEHDAVDLFGMTFEQALVQEIKGMPLLLYLVFTNQQEILQRILSEKNLDKMDLKNINFAGFGNTLAAAKLFLNPALEKEENEELLKILENAYNYEKKEKSIKKEAKLLKPSMPLEKEKASINDDINGVLNAYLFTLPADIDKNHSRNCQSIVNIIRKKLQELKKDSNVEEEIEKAFIALEMSQLTDADSIELFTYIKLAEKEKIKEIAKDIANAYKAKIKVDSKMKREFSEKIKLFKDQMQDADDSLDQYEVDLKKAIAASLKENNKQNSSYHEHFIRIGVREANIHNVKPDGYCFFRAVHDQIIQRQNESLQLHALAELYPTWQDLAERLFTYFLDHSEDYTHLMIDGANQFGAELYDYVRHADYDSYAADVATRILGDALHLNINIYDAINPGNDNNPQGGRATINLGRINNNHFISLRGNLLDPLEVRQIENDIVQERKGLPSNKKHAKDSVEVVSQIEDNPEKSESNKHQRSKSFGELDKDMHYLYHPKDPRVPLKDKELQQKDNRHKRSPSSGI